MKRKSEDALSRGASPSDSRSTRRSAPAVQNHTELGAARPFYRSAGQVAGLRRQGRNTGPITKGAIAVGGDVLAFLSPSHRHGFVRVMGATLVVEDANQVVRHHVLQLHEVHPSPNEEEAPSSDEGTL